MNLNIQDARYKASEDRRAIVAIVGFIYSPLVLLLGAAAAIGLG